MSRIILQFFKIFCKIRPFQREFVPDPAHVAGVFSAGFRGFRTYRPASTRGGSQVPGGGGGITISNIRKRKKALIYRNLLTIYCNMI